MKSKHRIGLASFLSFFLLSLFSVVWMGANTSKSLWAYGEDIEEKLRLFRLVLETIQKSYVEDVSTDELFEAAIHGILEELDPHTAYLPPDNFQRWNKSFEGFDGIGIVFDIIDQRPVITGFVDKAPAQAVGLQVADRILGINGHDTMGRSRFEIEQMLMDSASEAVELRVFSPLRRQEKLFRVPLSHLTLPSVTDIHMLSDGVGYVNVSRFTGTTARELDQALETLQAQGMRALIMDLRDNGGGYLSAAVEVADRFLPEGRLIVYTQGRTPRSYQEFRASRYHTYENLPVVILLNHGTASAAEIVAGALQDWDRALIVGTTSFGKGLVQSQYRFRDGSALLVTTARYYTPLGRCIQRDYFGMSKDEYYADAYREHPQLRAASQSAFRTPMGRTVYGGGGIVPDIIVDNSDNTVSDLVRALYFGEGNYFYKYALDYVAERPFLRKLTERELARLALSQKDLQEFFRLLAARHVPVDSTQFWKNADTIGFLLKRAIAYLCRGEAARFWINYERDTQLQVALTNVDAAEKLLHMRSIAQVVRDGE